MTVVPVLTTSCQVSEKLKKGPVKSHTSISMTFAINIHGEPSRFAETVEKPLNVRRISIIRRPREPAFILIRSPETQGITHYFFTVLDKRLSQNSGRFFVPS